MEWGFGILEEYGDEGCKIVWEGITMSRWDNGKGRGVGKMGCMEEEIGIEKEG
jgi:hypothetical protein